MHGGGSSCHALYVVSFLCNIIICISPHVIAYFSNLRETCMSPTSVAYFAFEGMQPHTSAFCFCSAGGLQLKHSYAINRWPDGFFPRYAKRGHTGPWQTQTVRKKLPPRACCTFIRATFQCYGWSRFEYLPAICGAQRGGQKLEHCYAICYTCFYAKWYC